MYVLITGGFDPLHSGHIQAFRYASAIGKLIVGVNSDEWLIRKKKSFLLPREERATIIRNLSCVHDVLTNWSDNDGTACEAIQAFRGAYSRKGEPLLFANGGDRTPQNASDAEVSLCVSLDIMLLYGVGGDKTQSSSNFLAQYLKRINNST